ncbi:type II toxin-antitoxin system VapC family toxin [Candidatus Poriferisodalis sp.]|uniref:type II toxin-antitoxin system VapC family toxin n=1 Tax=Candidatus Poriferisodalis sp. TaxID=3101277 RepID=UPI003AF52B05
MLILDTNVVSELMREHPRSEVLAWIDRQLTDDLYVTTVTEAEIRTGIAILPEETRRRGLTAAAAHAFEVLFAERVLPFDSDAAQAFAAIAATRRSVGHPISQADCQIAAIARSVGASIATRNVSDFEGCGIDVVNPEN